MIWKVLLKLTEKFEVRKKLCSNYKKIKRNRTRMTRIGQIKTDKIFVINMPYQISGNPVDPRHQRSISSKFEKRFIVFKRFLNLAAAAVFCPHKPSAEADGNS